MVINDPFVRLLVLLPLEGAPPSPLNQTHPSPLDVGVVLGTVPSLPGEGPILPSPLGAVREIPGAAAVFELPGMSSRAGMLQIPPGSVRGCTCALASFCSSHSSQISQIRPGWKSACS